MPEAAAIATASVRFSATVVTPSSAATGASFEPVTVIVTVWVAVLFSVAPSLAVNVYSIASISPSARKSNACAPLVPEVNCQVKSDPAPSAPKDTVDPKPVVASAPLANSIMLDRFSNGTVTPSGDEAILASVMLMVTVSIKSSSETDKVPEVVTAVAPLSSVTPAASAKARPSMAPAINGTSFTPTMEIVTLCKTCWVPSLIVMSYCCGLLLSSSPSANAFKRGSSI